MAVFHIRFDAQTRDFAGQTITSSINAGIPWSDRFIYKALPTKLLQPSNYMLDAAENIVLKAEFPSFNKTSIIADGVDEATVLGLPVGTNVLVSSFSDEVSAIIKEEDNGQLAISAPIPGDIVVVLRAVNYKDSEIRITAL